MRVEKFAAAADASHALCIRLSSPARADGLFSCLDACVLLHNFAVELLLVLGIIAGCGMYIDTRPGYDIYIWGIV